MSPIRKLFVDRSAAWLALGSWLVALAVISAALLLRWE